MKLDIQNVVGSITAVGQKIGAESISWSPDFRWNSFDPNGFRERLDKYGEIEDVDLKDVIISKDGTLEFAGKKILVYIRDRVFHSRYEFQLPKFHIANCKTLQDARRGGKFDKYVVSTRTDGKFKIRKIYKYSNETTESDDNKLDVCINCLKELKYSKGYSTFSIKNFFEQHKATNIVLPKYNDNTAPTNDYPNYWRTISRQTKLIKNYTCENCGKYLKTAPNFLQVHHKNRIKYDNRPENLAVLCVECHSKQGWDHERIKDTQEYKDFIRQKMSFTNVGPVSIPPQPKQIAVHPLDDGGHSKNSKKITPLRCP